MLIMFKFFMFLFHANNNCVEKEREALNNAKVLQSVCYAVIVN